MQSHHYLLIAIALIAGYALATVWPAPAAMAKGALANMSGG